MKQRTLRLLCAWLLLCLTILPTAAVGDAPPYRGIDVSRWQETVDWSAVKAAGVEFAVIRCYSYRKDVYFETNYAGACAQGIPVGAYVYMYATTPEKAVAEALAALDALNGRPLTLPLFLDVEERSVLSLGKSALTDLMLLEMRVFEAAGYRTGFYTSQSYVSAYMDAERLAGYDRWIAKWSCYTTETNGKIFTFADQDPERNRPDCDMWQFSNGGNGCLYGASSAYVDLDYCYTDYLHPIQTPPAHLHTFSAVLTEPTCTAPGQLALTCTACGTVTGMEYAPASGHTAPDENSCCTRCGAALTAEQPAAERVCPLCGETHTGMFGWLVLLLHTVLAYLKNLL